MGSGERRSSAVMCSISLLFRGGAWSGIDLSSTKTMNVVA